MDRYITVSQKNERLIIGVMSGTSLDGIDLALVKARGSGMSLGIKLLNFKTYAYPADWRNRIQAAFQANTEELCKINFDLGRFYGELICRFCREIGFDMANLDLIGSHGQTIYHVHRHSTLQIGEADVIANLTDTIVVSDFRSADIAAGGCGAPLVPYLDQVLFHSNRENLAIQNIGGIANVTFLPKDPSVDILAFDTGPGNAILNELTEIISNGKENYDENAKYSSRGRVDTRLLNEIQKHDYFNLSPPKSTGREVFGREFVRSLVERHPEIVLPDMLRTLVSLVTNSIAAAYDRFLPKLDRIYISGGGAHHPTIVKELKQLLGEDKVRILETNHQITADSKEAVAFAVLAHERLNSVPTNVPSVTGARYKALLGKISVPI